MSLRTPSFPLSRRRLALLQGGYYASSGLWALVDLRSFERVTGPKTDGWLVKTVGALVTVVGGALGLGGWRRRLTPELELLAVGSACSLAAIETITVARNQIRAVYLLDALIQLLLVSAWLTGRRDEPPDGGAGEGFALCRHPAARSRG